MIGKTESRVGLRVKVWELVMAKKSAEAVEVEVGERYSVEEGMDGSTQFVMARVFVLCS